jgi:uncharacterized protein with HEPN domain
MTRHDPIVTLRQMRDHAREAMQYAAGRARSDLDSDRLLELALVRLVQIVGEAATRLPEDFRVRHPDIPWRRIIGTRNILVHGYEVVDLDVIWTTI